MRRDERGGEGSINDGHRVGPVLLPRGPAALEADIPRSAGPNGEVRDDNYDHFRDRQSART